MSPFFEMLLTGVVFSPHQISFPSPAAAAPPSPAVVLLVFVRACGCVSYRDPIFVVVLRG